MEFLPSTNFCKLIIIGWIITVHAGIYAQSNWTNPITGTNPNISNPYTSGQTVNSNITVSGIGRGAGISGSNANDRYNANNWSTTSIDLTDYFTFTLTPKAGFWIDLSSFVYTAQASNGNGPNTFAFRSSLDNFTNNIGSPNETGTTITLGSPTYVHITNAIEFRFYAWGANNGVGTFSINDFTFNGLVNLPIQLSSFDVIPAKKPIINWTTYSELNNQYFSIERSKDGSVFKEITKVPGNGTTDKKNEYTYTDLTPYNGINYYRLKQIDVDGTSTTYPMKAVIIPVDDITIYPTAFEHDVTLQLPATYDKAVHWTLSDACGRSFIHGVMVQSQKIQHLEFPDLVSGTYILSVLSEGYMQSFKLVKL